MVKPSVGVRLLSVRWRSCWTAAGPESPRRRGGTSRAAPVMLGTLSVRVDPSAERMAIDSALEVGAG